MHSLEDVFNKNYADEASSMEDWCRTIYETYFSNCYTLMNDIKDKLSYDKNGYLLVKLSDDDIERILTELPLDLYTASEALNKLRLQSEMIKLKYKQVRKDIMEQARIRILDRVGELADNLSKSDMNAMISEEASEELLENELLIRAYDCVIVRADNERSSCRELIMSAKKIFDSRRSAEESNPVSEVVPDIPDYRDTLEGKKYIK